MEGTVNYVHLCGTPAARPDFSHLAGGERYFTFPLEIERLSGTCDRINVVVREALASLPVPGGEANLNVVGELRSFNNKKGEGSRLVITVLARQLYFSEEEHTNTVRLRGTICKPPNLRKTPMGRQICDLMLAVGRRYGRSDYLPCIAWGRLAEETARLAVGDAIALEGRIQSRQYIKTQGEQSTARTAFEVSVVALADGDAE